MSKTTDRTAKTTDEATGLVRYANAFEALYDDKPEVAAKKYMRALILRALRKTVEPWPGTQTEKADRLGITQPRFALLMKSPMDDRFTLDNLVDLAAKAGLRINVTFTLVEAQPATRATVKVKPAERRARSTQRVTEHA